MKVIGQIPNDKYDGPDLLVQIGSRELKMLAFADEYKDVKFPVGTKLKVSEQYERLKRLDGNRKELDGAIGVLRAVAMTLSPLTDLVGLPPPPKQPAPPEGEQEGGQSNG